MRARDGRTLYLHENLIRLPHALARLDAAPIGTPFSNNFVAIIGAASYTVIWLNWSVENLLAGEYALWQLSYPAPLSQKTDPRSILQRGSIAGPKTVTATLFWIPAIVHPADYWFRIRRLSPGRLASLPQVAHFHVT
jgi:hypothetical protein